jgi:hypothetical protein
MGADSVISLMWLMLPVLDRVTGITLRGADGS